MNRPFTIHNLLFSLFCLLLSAALALGGEKLSQQPSPEKPTVFEWKFLDGNQINCTIASDGPFADYRRTYNSGIEWPKGTGKKPLFTAGIWITGRHRPSDSLRTANMDYQSEYQPGPLLEIFNTTTNDDTGPVSRSGDPRYRLYKIQRGDTVSQDYVEWPGDLGAPYEDVNENGVWDSGIDRPRLLGDQQIWWVINDASNSRHQALCTTPPLGIEVQSLFYCFDRPGVLGNTMFMEWMIINKSDADYDSVFVGIWSDADLGGAGDDLPGSDSTLGLGYVYNGDDDDGTNSGYGNRPPAAGFVMLAGPLVQVSPTDSAWFNGRWVNGYRNRPPSSYVAWPNASSAVLRDPPHDPRYPGIAYNYHLGKAGWAGYHILRPDSSLYPSFWFSGDPVTGEGDLPHNFPLGPFHPDNIRMMLNAGPFDLAKADTQYFAASFVISRGTDRLNSVSLLKQDVTDVKEFFFVRSGEPPQRYLSVWPDALSYENTEVGQTSESQTVVLNNVGLEEVTVLNVAAPGQFQVMGPTAPFTLGSGETVAFTIHFAPQEHGAHVDSLQISTTDSADALRKIFLSGYAYTMFPARAGVLYASRQNLHTIDPLDLSTNLVGALEYGTIGLAIHPSTHELYGTTPQDAGHTSLHRICAENLDMVPVATIPLGYLRAIAFSREGQLYGGTSDGSLYHIRPDNGDTTLIGVSSLGGYNSFSTNPITDTLWAAAASWPYERDRIFTVNRVTGEGTLVGRVGENRPVASIAFGPDGTLYGLQSISGGNVLIQIDTSTGRGTTLGSLDLTGFNAIAMRTDTITTGMDGDAEEVPRMYALEQNYPNPFNPSTIIEFALPHAGYVTLKLYNVLGEGVATLIAGQHDAGTFKAVWDASGFPSGVYFYRLAAGEYVQTKKMILMK
jgi:hypothetical protein